MADWKKYLVVFLITVLLFLTAIYLSNYLGERKLDKIKNIQDTIALDILSSETRFALLKESSCEHLVGESALSEELASIGARLSFMERQLGSDNEDVLQLKSYYSLLEIKDYLLMRELARKCAVESAFILYFYSKDCQDCERQGYVLDALREKYPELRVYSFDADLETAAVKTMLSIYGVTAELPALFWDKKLHSGFQELEKLEPLFAPYFPER